MQKKYINTEEVYLTSQEAMAFLRIGSTTLWKLVKNGTIKKYPLTPKSVFYKLADLKDAIERSAIK
ncbi:helix-turn-helix transcriptional regulator [Campylobacter fetus]|uniref:Helix-turn-helix domain-containing protein n=1 Tax=Campylobacter fetus subsp. testudinum TaxID=1507806 RepID=A0AAX0H9K2_CAMFE|nr:helix-turn-helix domain-containing protein [Campylobacter fetus]OCR90250.1 hypothetical protein CFT12S02225_07735 [Campylobacter fetus subsp. testudinum]OCR93840.1 hypothetical protein CFT12S02842_07800 [Campylobacter fetus subsp. testudinum]OCS02664.1 hypothetical protein CFTCF782_07695 [Campylobacter fetus subsp. testudinum]